MQLISSNKVLLLAQLPNILVSSQLMVQWLITKPATVYVKQLLSSILYFKYVNYNYSILQFTHELIWKWCLEKTVQEASSALTHIIQENTTSTSNNQINKSLVK